MTVGRLRLAVGYDVYRFECCGCVWLYLVRLELCWCCCVC